eukprot:294226_1
MAEESTRLPPFQITVLVEEKNIGCLIGKKGNAITEIRNNTNANISSHLLRNSSEKTVDICVYMGTTPLTFFIFKICMQSVLFYFRIFCF